MNNLLVCKSFHIKVQANYGKETQKVWTCFELNPNINIEYTKC